jgi:hypothetical protein
MLIFDINKRNITFTKAVKRKSKRTKPRHREQAVGESPAQR